MKWTRTSYKPWLCYANKSKY